MKAEKIIRLRIQNSTFCRRIRVVQGDTGRIFRFILEDITMDGSEQARVYAKKPDGTEVYNDCEVVSTNEVLMESDSGQIFAAIGVVQAEIQISKSGKTITTYTFEFDVEISLTRAGAIQSSSEYGALEAAIAKAEGFYNPTFAEAKTRDNINSGESIPTLFGKVKKWFTDLNTLIKLVGSTDISGIGNGTVTDALSVLNSKPCFKTAIYNSVNKGWYRIAQISTQHELVFGLNGQINIRTSYSNWENESISLLINGVFNNVKFTPLCILGQKLISDVRCISKNNTIYIDVCYALEYENGLYVDISCMSNSESQIVDINSSPTVVSENDYNKILGTISLSS